MSFIDFFFIAFLTVTYTWFFFAEILILIEIEMIKLFLTYSLIMLVFKFYIDPFQINPSRHKKIHISKGGIQNGKKWGKFHRSRPKFSHLFFHLPNAIINLIIIFSVSISNQVFADLKHSSLHMKKTWWSLFFFTIVNFLVWMKFIQVGENLNSYIIFYDIHVLCLSLFDTQQFNFC